MDTDVPTQRLLGGNKRHWRSVITSVVLFWSAASALPASTEILQTHQPGWTITWEGQVQFIAPQRAAVPVNTNQFLNFGDALHTLALSRAVIRLKDWSDLRLKDRTRLEIVRLTGPSPSPGIKLHDGEIYFSSRGGPRGVPVETPHARGTPKGTEFLVRVDAGQTEVTMFDGEVELSNGIDVKSVRSGQQGIAAPGQPIQIRPILEARNIVQWWIYYPGVVDLDDISLTPAEQTALSATQSAYRRGNLAEALRRFPGYPTPQEPSSEGARTYLAALLLGVGAVDRAEALLGETTTPAAVAVRRMIAAVSMPASDDGRRLAGSTLSARGASSGTAASPTPTASELLALSFAHQATNNLKSALDCARQAIGEQTTVLHRAPSDQEVPTRASSSNGFAWARVAELEFSFGRTRAARLAVERALALSPDNAQAHCVHGFLLAAQFKLLDAIAAFDTAIALDPALGNAWLGRGLCKRRMGVLWNSQELSKALPTNEDTTNQPSWLRDLQTAAALEPRRSLFRSYLGKAFSDHADQSLLRGLSRFFREGPGVESDVRDLRASAQKELGYAARLDPNDPTPPLYSALESYQQNRPNEAVEYLERSIELNDNRALFRSRSLLDQDMATRGASLAKIYQDAGLHDVALREATRAVSADYANPSAHRFLAESYDALRDPTRFNLRHETVWFNELLLANLLSPVGAGLLSQNISHQEYSRLFDRDRVSLLSSSEVRSDGQFRQLASQSAVLGRTAYTIDLNYQHNRGGRPNSDLDLTEWYTQFKHQWNDRDSLFVLTKYQEYESGDNFQRYDSAVFDPTLRIHDSQKPIAVAAWHREWRPGVHSVFMGGRLTDDQQVEQRAGVYNVRTNSVGDVDRVLLERFNRLNYANDFGAAFAEAGHIWQTDRHTWLAGGRAQWGDFQTDSTLGGLPSLVVTQRYAAPVVSHTDGVFERFSAYVYDTWELSPRVHFTGGLTLDHARYPKNFRFPPLQEGSVDHRRLSPKASMVWDASRSITVRAVYSQALGGASFDDSFRLEPTQLAGFGQAFRSLISEAEAGSSSAPRHEIIGLAVDAKLPTRTYLGAQAGFLRSRVAQDIGVFLDSGQFAPPQQAFAGSTREALSYREAAAGLTLHQLVGDHLSIGTAYQFTQSRLHWLYPDIPRALTGSPSRTERSRLHQVGVSLHLHHPSGLFGQAESAWLGQSNTGYGIARGDEWTQQVNLSAGWRFLRRRAELSAGILNLLDEGYRLNSLTPYSPTPQERVFYVRFKWML